MLAEVTQVTLCNPATTGHQEMFCLLCLRAANPKLVAKPAPDTQPPSFKIGGVQICSGFFYIENLPFWMAKASINLEVIPF